MESSTNNGVPRTPPLSTATSATYSTPTISTPAKTSSTLEYNINSPTSSSSLTPMKKQKISLSSEVGGDPHTPPYVDQALVTDSETGDFGEVQKRRTQTGKPQIAVFGGSFNPPAQHHLHVVSLLQKHGFDEIIVVPCGLRPDKPNVSDIPPIHRAILMDLAFSGREGVEVDLFDLESEQYTHINELQRRYEARGEITHIVGSDLLETNDLTGLAGIRGWQEGDDVWPNLSFGVIERPDFKVDRSGWPPKSLFVGIGVHSSCADIRQRMFQHQVVGERLVPNRVLKHLQRYRIYQITPPTQTRLPVSARPTVALLYDVRNPRAGQIAEEYRKVVEVVAVDSTETIPELLLCVGGDGFMLHCIRQHWRRRIPFFGVNAGHLGFLLNGAPENLAFDDKPSLDPQSLCNSQLKIDQLPLLRVECEDTQGNVTLEFAFNDAWVERSAGQTAWIKLAINDVVRIERVMCDGMLVATSAGSTAYAHSMGASPVPISSGVLVLVGSNVADPARMGPAYVDLTTQVAFTSLDPQKRPCKGFVDGIPQGSGAPIKRMQIRASQVASIELAFDPNQDLTTKLLTGQFPSPQVPA